FSLSEAGDRPRSPLRLRGADGDGGRRSGAPVGLPLSRLQAPELLTPTVEVYEERACHWLPDLGIPREP
ncbi:MAG TPA: hypothetical protein VES64_05200, partial [Allosphingosinicella sp.]|nr:hypothetical protein [Allosphingosinicella sp.]